MEKRVEPLIKNTDTSQLFGIIIAIFAVLLTLVLFAIWQRRKSSGRSILLMGISGTGKTLLYARLIHSKFIKTYLSTKENTGDIVVKDRSLQIVDIPGQERLRGKFFDKYKASARGIVYVIDSVSVFVNHRDVAEYLYTLLSDPSLKSNTPLLILCNKQDQGLAVSSTTIKSLLETEINLIRKTKSNQLEATDSSLATKFIGAVGEKFKFSQLNNKIDFAECSAYTEVEPGVDIKEFEAWLNRIV